MLHNMHCITYVFIFHNRGTIMITENKEFLFGYTRAKAQPDNTELVDVEALKSFGVGEYPHGWNDCLDHLNQRGMLRTPVEKIDGLEELLRCACDEDDDNPIFIAAKRYLEMSKKR